MGVQTAHGCECTLQEAEEPIEEFIDVPSLPAAEEGTRKRDAVEPQRGRRPLKRLKRIYQSEAGAVHPRVTWLVL